MVSSVLWRRCPYDQLQTCLFRLLTADRSRALGICGCVVCTERVETAADSCGISHASAVSTPLRWILKKRAIK